MNAEELDIRQTTEGLLVRLHVQPRAKRCEIVGIHNSALKVKVTAPPVDDAANRAIVEYFSSLLGMPKSNIQITAGLKSRDKTIQIKGIALLSFIRALET